MLKIKDDVDLKILEKYGFKKEFYYDTADCYIIKHNDRVVARIVPQNRQIKTTSNLGNKFNHDLIYDLIKADLVEKVEE